MQHMIRACLIALRLADSVVLDDSGRGVVYNAGLLAWAGCHTVGCVPLASPESRAIGA